MSTDRSAFTDLHRRLVDLERQAEIDEVQRLWDELPDEELERRGVTLQKLTVADRTVGLGGRALAVLEPSRGGELPVHRFQPGDVVAIRPGSGPANPADTASGVVARTARDRLWIALDDEDANLPERVRVDRIAPDVTYRRLKAALTELERVAGKHPAAALAKVAFDGVEPDFDDRPTADQLASLDAGLDHAQRDAVLLALRARDIALVHGPPGTGKTTTVVEIVRQSVARGERVLASAPSNVAVDNLAERLIRHGVRLVRLGHPARLLPAVREHSLDALTEQLIDPKLTRALKRDIADAGRSLARTSNRGDRRRLRDELRRLRRELRELDRSAVRGVLDTVDVVLATTTGAADGMLEDRAFDLVVLDEAAQAVEAAAWIPLLRGRRAVLVGDHRQLPPTVISVDAARQGYATTLFERLDAAWRDRATRMLTVQYRMHDAIMAWASAAMYAGELEADPSVAAHRLVDLAGVVATPDTEAVFLWIDTAGCGHDETEENHDGSKANPGEADLVATHVGRLLAAGVPHAAIGVITPYNAQVRLLRDRLATDVEQGLEIGSVDGFQGREKEAIVLSTVRSNERGDVGFLAERRRMNVAVTRARRHVAIVGDSATLACDEFLAGLVDHAHARGGYRSAFE